MAKIERKKKMFIVQKVVMAMNVEQAIKQEKKERVSAVFLDEDWKKNNL